MCTLYPYKNTCQPNSISILHSKYILRIHDQLNLLSLIGFDFVYLNCLYTGQCKRTGGCYNELVVAFFSTGGGVKGKNIYTS